MGCNRGGRGVCYRQSGRPNGILDYFLGESVRAGFRGRAGKGWESQQKKTDLNSQAGKTRCAPVSAGQGVVLHDVSARPL